MGDTVTVVGEGSWGTTLAKLLALGGNDVKLLCHFPEVAEAINSQHQNPNVFSAVTLPQNIIATTKIECAFEDSSTVYLVVPTRFLRQSMQGQLAAWQNWAKPGSVLCNCTKGLLLNPTQRTDDWLAGLLPDAALVHLAGPNLASELMAGNPAAAVAAGPDAATKRIQRQLKGDTYRIYTGTDTVGVEVAGFYKNIIAIAAGCVNELGLGDNTRSVLITRGLTEMGRLTEYFGGKQETLHGMAGVGDMIATCSSTKSRNFQVGVRRAKGQSLEQINAEMTQVAEGIQASEAVHMWPGEHGLSGWPDLPIAAEVYHFVHQAADPRQAITRLMGRPPKAE